MAHVFTINRGFLYREPISIIKLLSLPVILIAFLPIVLYEATLTVSINCGYGLTTYSTSWAFPLNLLSVKIPADLCYEVTNTIERVNILNEDHSGIAITWTALSVITVFYIMATLCLLFFFWDAYAYEDKLKSFAFMDLVISMVLVIFWFITTIVMFIAVAAIQNNTSYRTLTGILSSVSPCNGVSSSGKQYFDTEKCSLSYDWMFGAIWCGPIFGFLLVVLMIAHCVFIYRKVEQNRELAKMKVQKLRNMQMNMPKSVGYRKRDKNIDFY